MCVQLKISLFKAITFLVLRWINLDVRNAAVTVKLFYRYLLGYDEENQRTFRSKQRVSWLSCATVACLVPKHMFRTQPQCCASDLSDTSVFEGALYSCVCLRVRALCLLTMSKAKIIKCR
jgi:hypothetical protein